jgi:hypothetical protein
VPLSGPADRLQLTARLGPASLGLAPAAVTVRVEDADGNAYDLGAGLLTADGRDRTLSVTVGDRAIYPLRLISVSLDYPMPGTAGGTAVFAVDRVSAGPGTAPLAGTSLSRWPASAASPALEALLQLGETAGPSGSPAVLSEKPEGGAMTVTFSPGYGRAGLAGVPTGSMQAHLALAAPSFAAIPGLATRRFLAAANASVGSTVQTHVNGADIPVKIVAAVATFPTVSAPGGALIVDLSAMQDMLAASAAAPAQATQWWLATSAGTPSGRVPPGLRAVLPAGSSITSAGAVAAGLLGNPLSTVPQNALLAVAIAAAVLAIAGFCVSIAAGLRQRRAENALLAALGVAPRAMAGQLCLEKLMLSLPSALAGLALGVVIAELLVPAITLTPTAAMPVPPVLIQFGWSQTLPLALAVAALPVLVAALTIVRRPDAAAELRAAEAT